MKSLMRIVATCALLGTAVRVNAEITVGVDPGQTWIGYMNWSELPENGGAFVSGSGWGTADLVAVFNGTTLTLAPNSVNDASAYWYTPSGGPGATGNKTMDANFYVEDSATLPGELVTFTGSVLTNTLVSPYTSRAFIKDFAPDYSSFNAVYADLVTGVFSISLQTAAEGHHAQYGFETVGPCVWITDAATKGTVTVTAVSTTPPPTALRALRIAAGLDPAPTPESGAEFIALNAATAGSSISVIDIEDAIALAKAGKI